ncbi:MAG: hypothetical protein AB7I33_02775 [Gemmatimonadales bacterium]
MTIPRWLRAASVWTGLLLIPGAAAAQVPVTPVDSVRVTMDRLAARLDSLESGRCPTGALALPALRRTGNAAVDSLISTAEALAARVGRLSARCGTPAAPAADTAAAPGDELAALRAAAAEAAGVSPDSTAADTSGKAVQFIGRQRNLNQLNPEISATGDIRLVARDGRQEDNGVAREFEFAFQSALDPYSTAKIFITMEQEHVGIEEGYIYWSGLPGRLRADVGKFRQEVGTLNRWHLHALPESEYPLVYQRYLSEDGLSGTGLSLYTLLPVSLGGGSHELYLQGTTAEDVIALQGSRQPAVLARLQNFWQVSRSTYMQLGFTGFGGRNADSSLTSRLWGGDFRLTWRPPQAGTRREVTLRTEGYLLHSKQAGSTADRYGGFADLAARVSQHWVLSGRYDYVEAPFGTNTSEWQVTAGVTRWQSEFVFLRLEALRHHDDAGSNNQLIFQVVWAMGPHKHETY